MELSHYGIVLRHLYQCVRLCRREAVLYKSVRILVLCAAVVAIFAGSAVMATVTPHGGMLQTPDVSSTHIVFSYANDRCPGSPQMAKPSHSSVITTATWTCTPCLYPAVCRSG
jgi:hypothetical protein